jgi:GNAT superfamily N-acetyltransferase
MAEVFDADDKRTLSTIISFLEMTEPPRRPQRPTPMRKIAILRAEQPPLSFYLWLYRTVGAEWNWTDRIAMAPEDLRAVIHDPAVEIMVLYVGGVPAGFAELDFRRGDTAELALFGLLPDFIGQGLGGYFLDWVIQALWRPGVERALVDTNTRDHPRALAMYQKAGFQVVRREQSWLVPHGEFPPAL